MTNLIVDTSTSHALRQTYPKWLHPVDVATTRVCHHVAYSIEFDDIGHSSMNYTVFDTIHHSWLVFVSILTGSETETWDFPSGPYNTGVST